MEYEGTRLSIDQVMLLSRGLGFFFWFFLCSVNVIQLASVFKSAQIAQFNLEKIAMAPATCSAAMAGINS